MARARSTLSWFDATNCYDKTMGLTQRLALALALLTGTSLYAQVAEFGASGGMSMLRNNVLTTVPSGAGNPAEVKLKDGWRMGARITLNTFRFFGHEFGYAYNRTQLAFETQPKQELGMAIHQGFYNFLLYGAPEGYKVRPFAAGGAHFANFVPPGSSVTSGGGSTKFGFNYGGGVKVRAGSMFLIRVDLRQYHTPKPDWFPGPKPPGWLRQIEASAGFSLVM